MSAFIWYCFPRTGNPLTWLGPQICSIQNCHIVVIVSVYIFCISLIYLEILSADTDSLLFFTNQQWLSLRWYQIFTSCCCGLSIWRKIQQLCKCMFLIACFFSLHFRGKKGYTHLYPFRWTIEKRNLKFLLVEMAMRRIKAGNWNRKWGVKICIIFYFMSRWRF